MLYVVEAGEEVWQGLCAVPHGLIVLVLGVEESHDTDYCSSNDDGAHGNNHICNVDRGAGADGLLENLTQRETDLRLGRAAAFLLQIGVYSLRCTVLAVILIERLVTSAFIMASPGGTFSPQQASLTGGISARNTLTRYSAPAPTTTWVTRPSGGKATPANAPVAAITLPPANLAASANNLTALPVPRTNVVVDPTLAAPTALHPAPTNVAAPTGPVATSRPTAAPAMTVFATVLWLISGIANVGWVKWVDSMIDACGEIVNGYG